MTGAAALSMIAMSITPEGRVKKAVKLVCAFTVILSLISGITDFDFEAYSKSMAEHKRDGEKLVSEAVEEQSLLEREYIENECVAYILDKAAALEISCDSASVTLGWSEKGYWYPEKAEMNTPYSSELAACLEAELGISNENQTWSESDG